MFQIILVVVMLYLGLNLNFGRFIFLQVRVACFAHFIGVTFFFLIIRFSEFLNRC